MLRIAKPIIRKDGGDVYLVSHVVDSVQDIDTDIWYKTSEEYAEYLAYEVCDAFVVGCLLPAVLHDEDIYVEGAVSDKLFYNIKNSVLYILSFIYGHKINLSVENVVDPHYDAKGVGCGCSLGIDSMAAMIQHLPRINGTLNNQVPDSYKITHLTYFNVGAMGYVDLDKAKLSFDKDIKMVRSFAGEVGLPVVSLESNFSVMYRDFDFDSSGDVRNFSAVLALQKLFGKYLYGSSFPIADFKFDKGQTGYYESLLAQMLSTNSTEIVIANPDMSRIDKTKFVMHEPLVQKYLYVCWKELLANRYPDSQIAKIKDNYLNCSHCDKCKRTLLALDLLGELDKFSSIFDVAYWNSVKEKYIAKVIFKKEESAFYKDLYGLLVEKKYPISPAVKKEISKLKWKASRIRKFVVKVKRRIGK